MYVSDYGFAISPDYWSTTLGIYGNYSDSTWLFSDSKYDWTISKITDATQYVFYIYPSGLCYFDPAAYANYKKGVRPAFYLNSNVLYSRGAGTYSDPIRLSVN